jgi:hypothetical protein
MAGRVFAIGHSLAEPGSFVLNSVQVAPNDSEGVTVGSAISKQLTELVGSQKILYIEKVP